MLSELLRPDSDKNNNGTEWNIFKKLNPDISTQNRQSPTNFREFPIDAENPRPTNILRDLLSAKKSTPEANKIILKKFLSTAGETHNKIPVFSVSQHRATNEFIKSKQINNIHGRHYHSTSSQRVRKRKRVLFERHSSSNSELFCQKSADERIRSKG